MQSISYVTIGDSVYGAPIIYSIKKINQIYPKSHIYIYNWGFTKKQVSQMNKLKNTHVIPWQKRRIKEKDVLLKKNIQYFINKFILLNKYYRYNDNKRWFQFKYCEKVYCLLDAAIRIDNKFIFLDGDAILISEINQLMKNEFDIGLTMRRMEEIETSIKRDHYPINVGVIFFFGTKDKRISFMIEWLKEIDLLFFRNERFVDQTGLNLFVKKKTTEDIYSKYYNEGVITLDEQKIKIKILPCEIYNYNWIEEGIDKRKVKIVHFKGWRHSAKEFYRLVKKSGI